MRVPPAYYVHVDMHVGDSRTGTGTKKARNPSSKRSKAPSGWISTWRGRNESDILYISMTISI